MNRRTFALVLCLTPAFSGQETNQRPSPFPEKNRQRESAAQVRPRRSAAARSKRPVSAEPVRTAPVAEEAVGTAAATVGTGKACFFSSRSGGAVTASGIDARPDELVAAHATYPFGSRVSVTNLANGKTVEVRIIDRLADTRRIISLCEAAARQLDFYEAGIADVRVDPLDGRAPRDQR